MARLAPYALLLAQVIVFFRSVLFSADWIVPYDLAGYHEPLAAYAARSLAGLRFPLWDNNTYCGFPFYANPQTQLFYPPAWPFFALFPLTGAAESMRTLLHWQVALHVWLGGVLMYRFLIRQATLKDGARLTPPAALLGATVFQLGGFFASQAQHLGVVCAGAWLPLMWSSAMAARPLALAAAMAMTWLAGYPAAALVNIGLTLPFGWRTVLLRALPLSLPLVLCQLAPALELSSLSTAPLRGQYKGTGGGIPLEAFVSLLWPNYHRIFEPAAYKLPYNPTYLYLYCGLLPLALCLLARGGAAALKRALAALALSTLWMLGEHTPVWRALHALLPTAAQSPLIPELALIGFIASVAWIAALGAARLSPRQTWAAVLIAAADLTLAGANRHWNTAPAAHSPLVTATQFEGSPVTLANLRTAVNQWNPPARIDIANDSMAWAAAATVTQVPTASGNDPLCLRRIKDVRLSFAEGPPWLHYFTVTQPLSPVLDLLNVRYLIAWEKTASPADALPLVDNISLPGHQLHENTNALPRFYLVNETRAAQTRDEALALLRSAEFDPRRWAIVEGSASTLSGTPPAAPSSVRVVRYLSRRVELDVTNPAAPHRPAFLVTSEAWYPGWRATIDNQPAPLLLTNAAFRGLAIPPGTHRVTMLFSPGIFYATLPVTAAAWLLWCAAAAVRLLRKPKSQ